jgi:hypothetical protein
LIDCVLTSKALTCCIPTAHQRQALAYWCSIWATTICVGFLKFVCLVRLAQLVDIPWRCSLKTQDILTPQLYRRDIIYTQSRNFTYHLVVSTLNHNVDYYTPLIIKRFLIITLLSSNFPDTNYSNYLSLCYFQLCYFFNNTGEAIIIHMLCPTFLVFSYNCCLFLF